MKLEDWLDDLCVRFIINLPEEELASVERICFQVEEAQWFYEDFIRPLDPTLPSMSLRTFCLRIFRHCPLMSGWTEYHRETAYEEFIAYKTRVPVRGAILLNDAMDQVVLVKGWKKGSNWSFPRGKINKDEKDLDCAIREVYEETGFDVKKAGLVTADAENSSIDVTLREQNIRLYVFKDVPMDTHFEPRTRKEISKIQWHRLSELPTNKRAKHLQEQDEDGALAKNAYKFYMVAPLLEPLRKWISRQRKRSSLEPPISQNIESSTENDVPATEEGTGVSHAPMHILRRQASENENGAEGPQPSVEPQINEDASAQLKHLLSIHSNAAPAPEASAVQSNEDRSKSLLALLKGEDNNTVPTHGQVGQSQPPSALTQTDLYQPHYPVPHQQIPRPIATQRFPSSAGIPFQFPQIAVQQRPFHFQPQQQMLNHATPPPARFINHPTKPVIPTPNTRHLTPAEFPGMTTSVPHGPAVQLSSQPPPNRTLHDLQRHGNQSLPFQPHFPDVHAPAVPAPSQLPPPTLTSHKLKLLQAFKNTEGPEPTKENEQRREPDQHVSETAHAVNSLPGHAQIPDRPTQSPKPLSALVPQQLSIDRRGSQSADHKQVLLSLFSKMPAVTPQDPARTPQPSVPVEDNVSALKASLLGMTSLKQAISTSATTDGTMSHETTIESRTSKPLLDKEFLIRYLESVAKGGI